MGTHTKTKEDAFRGYQVDCVMSDVCLDTVKQFLAYRESIGRGNPCILKAEDPLAYFEKLLRNNQASFDVFCEWLEGDPCADGWRS